MRPIATQRNLGRRALSTASVIIVALTALAAQARSERFTTYIFGTGNESCGEYLQAAEVERKARPVNSEHDAIYSMNYLNFASYADGLLSGANVIAASEAGTNVPASEAGSSTHPSGRMAWLENYCRQNPLEL